MALKCLYFLSLSYDDNEKISCIQVNVFSISNNVRRCKYFRIAEFLWIGFIFVSLLYIKDKSSIFYINGSNVPEYSKYLLTKKYLQQQCKVLPPIKLKSLNISIYIIMCQCEFDYFVAWLSKRIPNKKKTKIKLTSYTKLQTTKLKFGEKFVNRNFNYICIDKIPVNIQNCICPIIKFTK